MTESPVDRFLAAVESGDIASCTAWSEATVLDATVPGWRFRKRGVDAIREEYSHWFAAEGRFEELQRIAVPGGEVIRYYLTWVENGIPHAAHHAHVLTVDGDRITADTVLCGGRWPASLLAEMEAADAAEVAHAQH